MKKSHAKSCLLGAAVLSGLSLSLAPMQAQMNDGMAMNGMMDQRAKNAEMLIATLSEEKTEINTLAHQQARFRQMGGAENNRIARMYSRWIRDHKAGGPMLMRLIRRNGADPMQAKILKPPAVGPKDMMLMATHKDHEAAVKTSQMRYGATNSGAIKMAMHKRAAVARKHLRQMAPYHDMMRMAGGKMMMCPHCNVAMKDGECPMCKMTAAQMKKN